MRVNLNVRSTVSNSAGLSDVPDNSGVLERDTALLIDAKEGSFEVFALPPLFPANRRWSGLMKLNARQVFAAVQHYRHSWNNWVVDYPEEVPDPRGGGRKNLFPFQENWDHPVDEGTLQAIGANLAMAGQELFDYIFLGSGDAVLAEIGQGLRAASAERELVITIHSEEFFLPWGMVYTHPSTTEELAADGSNFHWGGFWGHRHILEHNPERYPLAVCLRAEGSTLIQTGINVDESIDDAGVPCIAPQLAYFQTLARLDRRVRNSKPLLKTAFSKPPFSDRIVYFCCHGTAAGDPENPNLADAGLSLTDQQAITGFDLVAWLKQRLLESRPVVFINTCQGGQMSTLFYRTIAAELLKRDAAALVGAQVDVPTVFAQRYAVEFFGRFLHEQTPLALGPLVRELTRLFLDKHRNPLGLVYSLYHGTDCRVEWCT